MLALAAPTGLSVRNVIPARIAALGEAAGMVDVMLDAGGSFASSRQPRRTG